MTIRFPSPRWLPATIGVLAGLLALKSVTLVRAITTPDQVVDLSLLSSHARAADMGGKVAADKPPPTPSNPTPPKPITQRPSGATPAPADAPDAKQSPPAEAGAAKPPVEPPLSAAERTVLLELRQRRQELDARAQALGERESVLIAAQQKLSARIEELQSLQQRLEVLEADRRRQDDASWQGLVKLYETMKPRDAATIFNDLAMPVLVQVMDRMKDAKAAAILAAMDPDKARLLTQELAKLRTRGDAGARQTIRSSPSAPRPPNG
jgi:flagellar motility protein MotE (MotC chaperone)